MRTNIKIIGMSEFKEMDAAVNDFMAAIEESKPKTMMNDKTFRLRAQLSVLKDVAKEYNGRTINNVIANLEARIKYAESHD